MHLCRPIVANFVEHGLPADMSKEACSYIQALFERHVGRSLAWLRSQAAAEYIPSIDASLVATLADLLKVYPRCLFY